LPVTNAINYEVKLYKDENVIDTKTVSIDTTSIDYGTILARDPTATYKVIVQAKGSGLYLDSPVSELAIKRFSVKDFNVLTGITITTDTTTKANTIYIDKGKLPSRMPGLINMSLVSTDDISDNGILNMVSFHKDHKLVNFQFNGRTGEYYRWGDDNRKYSLILLFDIDMNFLGYYTYQNP
jgi:hypothetical protein